MVDTPLNYLLAVALTATLTLLAVAIHYEALRLISEFHPRRLSGKLNIGAVIVLIIVTHCIEAIVFSAGYWLGADVLAIGQLTGMREHGPVAYIYFSLETFTTQSIGDIFPIGPLRLLASVQPLVGLILIGWSTSFTFLIMRRDWRGEEEGHG
ncbi:MULTISPECIES: ion channel [Cupriavidus]|uniref:Two pore domain potassium channel family protein n=1 Tax=Cupriavidus pauculus TaxID=82633 RepID=A0A3G8H723_9BURK|nr:MULTISPECIES: ion channel [Cupriavidus]AZG15910.1 two pore domain potassium channel family protein [Cupriavidus pauculus]MDT6963606.1 ion channel [Cupriavidus sp. SZY C1]